MHLKTNVKMGEVTNLSDARFAAALGAEFIGFNMSPSHPEYIAPEHVKEISSWLLDPNVVAEWEDEPVDVIYDTCERLEIAFVQLNQFNPQTAEQLKDFNLIQNIFVAADEKISEIITQVDRVQKFADYFMLSFETPELQNYFLGSDGSKLAILDFCRDYPVILNFDFNKENILEIIENFKPFGVNLKGNREIKPGYKDFDELNDLVEMLEID